MITPLTRFSLTAEALPDRLLPRAQGPRFALPGARELEAFGDLLGGESVRPGARPPAALAPAPQEPRESAPFPLPALLPPDVGAGAALFCTLPFERMGGTHARLDFPLLAGRGEVLLDGERIARFDGGPLTLELTDALRLRRRRTLWLRFDDDVRPAGVCGAPVLRVGQAARLAEVTLLPDVREKTVTLRAAIHAETDGEYLLRALPCPASGAQAAQKPPQARETALSLRAGETRTAAMTLAVPGDVFAPGRPYAAPVLRVTLLRRLAPLARAEKRRFSLRKRPPALPAPRRACVRCDEAVLMTGYPGPAPRYHVPLTREDVFSPPETLAGRLQALHIAAVALPCAGPDALYRALTRAGIAALHPPLGEETRERLARFACVCPEPVPAPEPPGDGACAAWQLCAMTGLRRSPRADATPAELLEEAAGFPVDADAPGAQDVLRWLGAVQARLCAEAARQGRLTGPLCPAGALNSPDVAEALRTALAPVHVSALPLRGAWWTRSRFSAAVRVFGADEPPLAAGAAPLRALALLEDETGEPLAQLERPCPPGGGELGVLEAALPDSPCVLTLSTRLLAGDAVLEQSVIPVYVGERGPLEAAFARG